MRGTVLFPATRSACSPLHEINKLANEESSIALEPIGLHAVTMTRPKSFELGNNLLIGEAELLQSLYVMVHEWRLPSTHGPQGLA
jgi:hypothetical protein